MKFALTSVLLQSTETFWLWQFMGRLHPMIVHFPIGLLFVALLLEIFDWKKKSDDIRRLTRLLVWIGSASALLAATLGLLLAQSGDYGDSQLSIHRWSGLATAVLALTAAFLLRAEKIRVYRYVLFLAVTGVSVAGHYGGMLTHGEDYLTSVLPSGTNSTSEQNIADADFVLTNHGELNDVQLRELNVQVRTVLAHNCYSCHGEAKTKGGLRLDSKEAMGKGGEGGVVLVPGHPDKSEIIRRITLPKDHKEAMPTKGKRLTAKEVEIVREGGKMAGWKPEEYLSCGESGATSTNTP
jgi:uncharacterized membrane protein/mono/diheme cytochrome c family protein